MSDPLNKHLMIDIETMGLKPNAPVMSIGAVWFDPEGNGWTPKHRAFYCKFDQHEVIGACKDGLDAGTILWWLEQETDAQKELTDKEGTVSVFTGLNALQYFIYENSEQDDLRDVHVWGNSNKFDIGTLENFFRTFKHEIPWHYSRDQNCRTISWAAKHLVGFEKPDMATGVKHNALDDARHQARYVEEMMLAIRNSLVFEVATDEITR